MKRAGNTLASLRDYLDTAGVPYRLEPGLVRGLDYYTRTVFEFQRPGAGAQNTLAAGGRYDNLISTYGGKHTLPPASPSASSGWWNTWARRRRMSRSRSLHRRHAGEPRRHAFALLEEAHGRGLAAEMDSLERSVKAQMKAADRSGYRWVIVVGEDELSNGYYSVRDMASSSQEQVSREGLWDHIM